MCINYLSIIKSLQNAVTNEEVTVCAKDDSIAFFMYTNIYSTQFIITYDCIEIVNIINVESIRYISNNLNIYRSRYSHELKC